MTLPIPPPTRLGPVALDPAAGSKAEALCAALAERIGDGRLPAGAKLPSQRGLARRLGISLGTVTRALRLAERRGLVAGEVGRGTFVRHVPARIAASVPSPPGTTLDLFQNLPLDLGEPERRAWAETMDELRSETDLSALLRAGFFESARGRAVGQAWIARLGLAPPPQALRIVPSWEAALSGILAARLRPGDTVGLPRLSLPLVARSVRSLSLSVRPIASDAQGLDPDDLARALHSGVRALVCTPTIDTPTATVLSGARRRLITELLRRHDAIAIELEANAFLFDDPPLPLVAHAPERVYLVADLRYGLSMGLHAHVLRGPVETMPDVAEAIVALAGPTPGIQIEVAARWLESGRADDLIARRRTELRARNTLARECFRGLDLRSHIAGHHVWLTLPHKKRSQPIAATAESNGVRVNEAAWFALHKRGTPQALRLCLGNAVDCEQLGHGFDVVRRAIGVKPSRWR